MEKKVMLTGVRPSGNLTLGNYLGAISNFVEKQHDYTSYIFIADLHAITSPKDPEKLKQSVYDCVAMYLACGVDLDSTIVFSISACEGSSCAVTCKDDKLMVMRRRSVFLFIGDFRFFFAQK